VSSREARSLRVATAAAAGLLFAVAVILAALPGLPGWAAGLLISAALPAAAVAGVATWQAAVTRAKA